MFFYFGVDRNFPIYDAASDRQLANSADTLHITLYSDGTCISIRSFSYFCDDLAYPCWRSIWFTCFLAVSLLASDWLDIEHTLSLTGMPDLITPSPQEKSILFWLAARFMVASNLLAFSYFPNLVPYSNNKRILVLSIYSLINLVIFWIIIFHE